MPGYRALDDSGNDIQQAVAGTGAIRLMDQIVQALVATQDDDLMLTRLGIAYQSDMTDRVSYDDAYFNKCLGYEDKPIATAINKGRIELVKRHYHGAVLDIGVGSGEFIKKRSKTWGYDINPCAKQWLESIGKYREDFANFDAFTMWDVLEHVEDPEMYFKHMAKDTKLFVSIPIFHSVAQIRRSKHYRPGEHLYYFTVPGLIWWMKQYRFRCLETATFEIAAGRDSIYSFAFCRD